MDKRSKSDPLLDTVSDSGFSLKSLSNGGFHTPNKRKFQCEIDECFRSKQ